MGHPLFRPHTPFLTLNVENKYSAHISVTYSRYVISLVEIHQVVSEESHRTDERTNGRTNGRNSWILYTPRYASGGYKYKFGWNPPSCFRDVDCRVLSSISERGESPILPQVNIPFQTLNAENIYMMHNYTVYCFRGDVDCRVLPSISEMGESPILP